MTQEIKSKSMCDIKDMSMLQLVLCSCVQLIHLRMNRSGGKPYCVNNKAVLKRFVSFPKPIPHEPRK